MQEISNIPLRFSCT